MGRTVRDFIPIAGTGRYEFNSKSKAYLLQRGNELCKGRMIPMSSQLITKVQITYAKCLKYSDARGDTPLMQASRLGLADMVWGFIQCSKETATNIHTQIMEEPLSFLWLQNIFKCTALDMAIFSNHVELAKMLLSEASRSHLESAWDSHGNMLFPLLRDPKYDRFIFDMMEKNTRSTHSGLSIFMRSRNDIGEQRHDLNSLTEKERIDREEYLKRDELGLNINNNTILHIVSKFGDVNYVENILKNRPSLISCLNSEGETPVYVAAREGHPDVLQIMFNHLKTNNLDIESLLIRSEDKNNALHIAIQNHHAAVVFLLLENIPQLANHENVLKESPLYLAAERSYIEIVKLILHKCRDTIFTGPNGKTAVHAAVISNSKECVRCLLDVKLDLVNEKDDNNWTPFFYAVHYNNSLVMQHLLEVDDSHSIGYKLLAHDNTSALHIAARRGHWETMRYLLLKFPGSSEFIDSQGKNILHVAIESNQTEVIEFIFQTESLTSLINQKDNKGNTPTHLLAASNFEMMQKVIDSRVNIRSLNKENRSPLDMVDSDEKKERLIKAIGVGTNICNKISSSSKESKGQQKISMNDLSKEESKGQQKISMNDLSKEESKGQQTISMNDLSTEESKGQQKISTRTFQFVDNLVLVASLIATATFAVALAVPGGYNSDKDSKQGTPYLLRKAAFQAFVISNALAFSSSCSVLLAYMVLLVFRDIYDDADEAQQNYIKKRILIMYFLTLVALLAMLIAFVTGFYVVLLPSLWLAIFICVLSICIVVGFSGSRFLSYM